MIVVIIFTRYSIQNHVDIHSRSDNTDENIMNIMMLMLDHVCGAMMILPIIIRPILIMARTINIGDYKGHIACLRYVLRHEQKLGGGKVQFKRV